MAAFSLGDQPLLDLIRSGFSGGAEAEAEAEAEAGAVSFDEHHLYLNQQRPIYNAVAYNHSLSLSDHFLMEFIPEMNGLSGFDYYAETICQPSSVLAQAGDVWGGVDFNMPSLGRKLVLESPDAVMNNDEKPQALYCPSALVDNVECTNQFGEKLSSSGSDYTSFCQVLRNDKAKKRNDHDVLVQNSRQTHKVKRLGNKCKSLRRANACEELKIDLCKESKAECTVKVVKKEEKEESPKGFIHVRARRGEATDSHSLAERVRREKIRERMKRLQDLVPGCSKVTGNAQLLDEIINYVQSLQSQVELLSVKLDFVLRHCNNSYVQVDGNPSQERIEEVLSVQGNTILPIAAYDTAINHVEEAETTAEPQVGGASFQ